MTSRPEEKTKTIDEAIEGHAGQNSRDGFDSLVAASGSQRHAWFLINPASRFLAVWDGITSITLLFIAVFTPIEVAFLPAPVAADEFLFILGRTIDTLFLLDMLLQCFIMNPVGVGGVLETRWGVIIYKYLTGWFLLDVFSIGASAFDIIPLIIGTADGRKSPVTSLRILRVLVTPLGLQP